MLELSPTTMASHGEAVARDPDGRVVFIEGALPGDRVLVEVTAERPRSASGRVTEILEAAPDRVVPPCPEIARGCGACQWQHITPEGQRRLKAEIVCNALRVGGVEPPEPAATVPLAPWAFRTTVRMGVVDGRAGFRRARSHGLVTVDGCLVAHPMLDDLIVTGRYPGAEEVLLRCGARTGERMAATRPAGLARSVPDDVHADYLHEAAAGRRWRISADSFFQTRPDGVDALAGVVAAYAGEPEAGLGRGPGPGRGPVRGPGRGPVRGAGRGPGMGAADQALDLYSGVGVFAGVLSQQGWSVTAVEAAPSAVADARVNLSDWDVRVVAADVTRWRPTPAALVVADPASNGLGRGGVAAVAATGARRVILVSCDAVSLGRDAGLLQRRGYRLRTLTLVDLFPHTFHVEVVSVFER